MATNTSKLALTKPDGTDLVDIAVLNANSDKLDVAAGAFICTSTTRPATPWNGQVIFETDTLNALVYRTSTTSWNILGGSTVASNPPTNAGNGNFWWDSDNGKLYIYYQDGNSGQWVSANSTASGVPIVSNSTERDSLYPTPAQGNAVFRNDLGVEETYYGLYNVSTNPGGRDTAGWYTTTRSGGLVPIRPTSVEIATGSGSANALGQVSFTGATAVSLNGIFTTNYQFYKIIIKTTATSANNVLVARYRASGTDLASNYYQGGTRAASNGSNIALAVNNGTYIYGVELDAAAPTRGFLSLEITNAERTLNTHFLSNGHGSIPATAPAQYTGSGVVPNTSTYDGISFLLASPGNMGGIVSVYGYND